MANTEIISQLTEAILDCDTDNEIGPQLIVDPTDINSIPSGTTNGYKLQFLVDNSGNPIGYLLDNSRHLFTNEAISILDKDGNPIDLSTAAFITTQFLSNLYLGLEVDFPGYTNPFAEAGDTDFCIPVDPTCPDIIQRTSDKDKGIDWLWKDGTWEICGYSPRCQYFEQQQPMTAVSNQDFIDIINEPNSPFNGQTGLLEQICLTIKNNDCLPAKVVFGHRYLHRMINVAPGTDVVQSFVAENNAQLFGPGQLGWGTETMYFCNDSLNNGSCDIGSGNQVDVSITSIEIAPGQEITVCINRELRVNSYLPKDGQSLPSNSWVLTAKLERNMDLI